MAEIASLLRAAGYLQLVASYCVFFLLTRGLATFVFLKLTDKRRRQSPRSARWINPGFQPSEAQDALGKRAFLPIVATNAVFYATLSWTARWGFSRIYFSVSSGWMWEVLAQVLVGTVVFDTWFYWSHRLMHVPAVCSLMGHDAHHKVVKTGVWAAHTFSVRETLFNVLFWAVALFVPVFFLTPLVGETLFLVNNLRGHSGYEDLPGTRLGRLYGRFRVTSLHHGLHHSTFNYNFGGSFRFWDWIMGTEAQGYAAHLDEILAKAVVHDSAKSTDGRGGSESAPRLSSQAKYWPSSALRRRRI